MSEKNHDISLSYIDEILSTTIKEDRANKLITFLAMLLNYTEHDQLNIGFTAEASTGKSYIPLEIAQYFPEEDIKSVGYCSPTAFFHDHGEWDEEEKIKTIDLHQKILIFLDQPHDMLLQRLRPILSHDQQEILVKITDRGKHEGLATKNILVIGYPTVIFCSTNPSMDEQERTRLLMLSPEITQDKLNASIRLSAEKSADHQQFQEELDSDPRRNWLRERIILIKDAQITEVIVRNKDKDYLLQEFYKIHRNLLPRHQRDFPRMLALGKAHALLNFDKRTLLKPHVIVAERIDLDEGFRLYSQISKPNELGLSPEIYDIFVKVFKSKMGTTCRDIQFRYCHIYNKPLGEKRLKIIIDTLLSAGLIGEEPDPADLRRRIFYSQAEEYIFDDNLAKSNKENTPEGDTKKGDSNEK